MRETFRTGMRKIFPAIVQKAPGQTVTPVPSIEGMESPDD